MSHGITKCLPCGKVIEQCRCPTHTKVILAVCVECEASKATTGTRTREQIWNTFNEPGMNTSQRKAILEVLMDIRDSLGSVNKL